MRVPASFWRTVELSALSCESCGPSTPPPHVNSAVGVSIPTPAMRENGLAYASSAARQGDDASRRACHETGTKSAECSNHLDAAFLLASHVKLPSGSNVSVVSSASGPNHASAWPHAGRASASTPSPLPCLRDTKRGIRCCR